MANKELEKRLQRDRLETELKHCRLEAQSLSAVDNIFKCTVQSKARCYSFVRNIEFTFELAEHMRKQYIEWLSKRITKLEKELKKYGTN